MKAFFATLPLLLCAVNCFGQDLRKTAAAQQACGPAEVKFDTKDGLQEHPVLPKVSQDKALVYLIQQDGTLAESCIGTCRALVKVGVDGRWTGATWGNSFLAASVTPGDHHFCIAWESREKKLLQVIALRALHAESGKTYFFGIRLTNVGGSGGTYGLELFPLDADEARMRLEGYPLSVVRPRL